MFLKVGKLYESFGEYDKAKEIYRSIIIRYTGDYWKSYVKQAEFALEDLKEKMKK